MKVMLPESQSQSWQALRFIREAQIAGQLQHPGILPIYEFGLDDEGRLMCVTRFVEGESFESLLDSVAEGHPPQSSLGDLIGIFLRACEAVAFAHSRGVIHCALDPAAITVGRFGEVLVGGWGLARVLPAGDEAAPLVSAPESPAQPALTRYTAPEQAEGSMDAIDARTDIHALGAILYRLITLRDAVTGETEEELLDQALSARPAPATVLAKQPPCPHWPGGKLPESLALIAMKALSVDREERHGSVEDLQREIAAWQEGASGGEHGRLWKQFSGILGRH
jgi:serine/threonine protein kinase